MMKKELLRTCSPRGDSYYIIKVKGVLDPIWAERFGNLDISSADGETVLTAMMSDQAALHGLLRQIRDLGLSLLLVQRIEPATISESLQPNK